MLNQTEAYDLFHKGTLALARAQNAGIRVDLEYLKTKIAHMDRQMAYYDRKFKESAFYEDWADFQDKEPNPDSTVQLRTYLYDELGYKPPHETEKGHGSVDKDALTALEIPELDLLLEMRKIKKNQDYLKGFQREQINGWLHPSFNLHLVKTYRSSSDHPNFQNIPKRDKMAMKLTRRALFPRPGHQLLEVDYGALEVRIAACYHKDPTMIKYLKEGFDLHTDMTKQIFKINDFDKTRSDHSILRAATKNGFVFPQFYGDYFGNCAEALACEWGELGKGKWKANQGINLADKRLSDHLIDRGIKSLTDFTDHIRGIEDVFWGKRFRVYAKWKERWWHEYQRTGYVDLLTGFRCKGIMRKNDAINYPIQGAAFHCLLWSLIKLDQELSNNWESRIIGQIHDAIVLDVFPPELPALVEKIKRITTEDLPKAWDWINVPLEVDFEICDIDGPWSEKKELNS
jgi:DNA polymerase I-like protein with 3'-5' exonuclease and polymerase domains